MVEITTLTRAASKGKSLKTIIPISIVRLFELKEGDKLEWKIKADNGEIVIIVKPFKNREGDEK